MAADAGGGPRESARYILITQCLQNDFFLNRDCRLFLPDRVARMMLLGSQKLELDRREGGRRRIPAEALAKGPLGLLLEGTIGRRRKEQPGKGVLQVINIRDWHEPDANYDAERRSYGAHCERGTWGAGYLDGLERYLDPLNSTLSEEARYFEEGSVAIHHVHSDSLFDFRPRFTQIGSEERKFSRSALEVVLDVLVQGSARDLERASELLRTGGVPAAIYELAKEIDEDTTIRSRVPVYVAAVGIYTDLKVKTLLTGLRTRYNLPNLAVSDTFTASATLARHLGGLDFASKVLGVEVIHGINDLVRYLGGEGDLEDEAEILTGERFSRYQSFFQDQQNVLAYESEKLEEYVHLTERRSLDVYESIKRSNQFLLVWGAAFLSATLVLAILAAIGVGSVDWKLPAVTGGLSLVQFVGAFFTKPADDLQHNLTNMAIFKMVLESHSLKTAFARFHLTTPQALREFQTEREAAASARQVEALRRQLAAIDEYDRVDFASLAGLGFGNGNGNGASAIEEAEASPATQAADPDGS